MLKYYAILFLIILFLMTGCKTTDTNSNTNDVTDNNIPEAVKYFDFASEYLKNKQYDSAIKNFQKAIEDSSKYKEAYIGLGSAYEGKMYFDKAESIYIKLTETLPSSAIGYIALGRLFTKLKEYDKAENFINKAIEIEPDNANALFALGDLYEKKYKGEEGIKKALLCYEKACEIDKEDLTLAYKYGSALIKNGEYKKAQAFLEKVVADHPRMVGPMLNLAEAYLESKDYSKAVTTFSNAIALDSTIVNAYLGLARSYQGMKNYDKAKNAYLMLVKIKPGSTIPYLYLGQMYYNIKYYDTAIKYLNKALNINPKDTRALLLIGQCYFFKADPEKVKTDEDRQRAYDNLDKAQSYFDKIIQLKRDYISEAKKGLKNISQWRKKLDPTRW